jgi:hypothetical protein
LFNPLFCMCHCLLVCLWMLVFFSLCGSVGILFLEIVS